MPITELRAVRPQPAVAAWHRPVRTTAVERFAMRAGLALVLWGRRRLDLERAAIVRRYRVARCAEAARADAERRYRLLVGR